MSLTRATMGRVLIIEERLTLTDAERALLTGLGYDVEVFRSARDGFRSFYTKRPDAVLVDLRVPDADADEVVRAMRAIDDTVPIVVMAADDDQVRDLLNDGVVDHLPTMTHLEAIERTVAAAIAFGPNRERIA
jgi:DNA-binding NtrC family response regulator